MVITDVLGRSREAKEYPDTSYNCPFCMAAVMAGSPAHIAHACPNPGCYARGGAGMPPYPLLRAEAEIASSEQRKREEEERASRAKFQLKYAEESRRNEEERLQKIQVEALARGACPACAIESARWGRTPKYTKHKKACPRRR